MEGRYKGVIEDYCMQNYIDVVNETYLVVVSGGKGEDWVHR